MHDLPTRPPLLKAPTRKETLTPPRRVLRRAEGLLTSTGQPTVEELSEPRKDGHMSPSKRAAKQIKRGMGSLRRMWSDSVSALGLTGGSGSKPRRHGRAHSVSGGAGGVGVNVHPPLLDVVGDAAGSGYCGLGDGGRSNEDPCNSAAPLSIHARRRVSLPASSSFLASSLSPPELTESKSSASSSLLTPASTFTQPNISINLNDEDTFDPVFSITRLHGPLLHPLPPLKEDHSHSFQTPIASPITSPTSPMSPSSPSSPDSTFKALTDVPVPPSLQEGITMTRVTARKKQSLQFQLDPDRGQIVWESKSKKSIPFENITEIRTGSDVQHHLAQLHLSSSYLPLWITIIYHLGTSYKILHLIAPSKEIFHLWVSTLRKLHEQRKELMSGLGNLELKQEMWAKQWWKGADEGADDKLSFEEVEKLCKRLNINKGREDLERMFKQADAKKRGYLDFEDFRSFVKYLKHRTEMSRIYHKVKASYSKGKTVEDDLFDYAVFETFMREEQKSNLSNLHLRRIFEKFATEEEYSQLTTPSCDTSHTPSPSPSPSPPESTDKPTLTLYIPAPSSPSPKKILTLEGFSAFLLSSDNPPVIDMQAAEVETTEETETTIDGDTVSALSAPASCSSDTKHKLAPSHSRKHHRGSSLKRDPTRTCSKRHSSITHDMTRPLSEYYISSSHNTYLVGHQLVGESTIEGYIRALLHGCRSVEVDIYDGDFEPMIFHGKTLTTKVSLREVCHAILKYGFVASPFPIIISAEVHCTVPQQDLIAKIMIDVFGAALVRDELDGKGRIEQLPSPEELKGRILLKTKNKNLSRADSLDSDASSILDSATSSTSESEFVAPLIPASRIVRSKSDAGKAINRPSFLQRVRSVGRAPKPIKSSSAPTPVTPNTPFLTPTGQYSRSPKVTSPRPYDIIEDPQQLQLQLQTKVKTSLALTSLLVYTVGVKCRGLNKKEEYAPEHMFSLSENTANKMLRTGSMMLDLIKHCRSHLVRIYPKGSRVGSSNCEPHRYWAAGCQLVAMNWQTSDLGYMINRAMFQRNGRCGYVLKPAALRLPHQKELLMKRTSHVLGVTIISAQQLPRPKDASGNEIDSKSGLDPWVEVSLHVPDWPRSMSSSTGSAPNSLPPVGVAVGTPAKVISFRTSVVKNNGFNPVWEEKLQIPFDCVGDLMDLVFVRFIVRQGEKEDAIPLAVYCASLGSLQQGYRHLPLHDAHLAQYLFSTLFVRIKISERS